MIIICNCVFQESESALKEVKKTKTKTNLCDFIEEGVNQGSVGVLLGHGHHCYRSLKKITFKKH